MKKVGLFFLTLLYAIIITAQPSSQINLQAVARSTGGAILNNKTMTLRISLLEGTATGTPVWVEQSAVISNQFGLINYSIGSGTPVGAFTYTNVNWATKKFVKLEIDPAGGLNFATLSTEELRSVPSANVAKTALSLNLPLDQTNTTGLAGNSGLTIRSTVNHGLAGITTKQDHSGVYGAFIGDANNLNGNGINGAATKNGVGVLGQNTESGAYGILGHPVYSGYFSGRPVLIDNRTAGVSLQLAGAKHTYMEFYPSQTANPGVRRGVIGYPDNDLTYLLFLNEFPNGNMVYQCGTGGSHEFRNGNVTISNSLQINGALSRNLAGFAFYAKNTNNTPRTGAGSGSYAVSLYASDQIVAGEFYSISDRRIKKDFQPSQNDKDLTALSQLEVTDYRHVDFITKGEAYKKGFIAQQVEQIFPEAVSKSNDFIPNVYQPAVKATVEGTTLRIDVATATTFIKGDKVRFYVKDKMYELAVENTEGSSFTINNWTNGAAEDVFVYGKQVNDFRTVDYDRIFTLNVSATQALIKRNQDLEKRVSELEQSRKGLEDNFKTLEGKVGDALKQLEKRVYTEGSSSAQINVSQMPKTVSHEK